MSNSIINILIVEDEIFASQYLVAILDELGYIDIFEANNSNDALQVVKNNKIDLIFMDINIKGGIDGIECSKLVNREYEIPIIYTTAYFDTETIKETTETNIYGYIIKPFNESNVEVTLSVAMKKIKEKSVSIILDKNIIQLDNELLFNLSTRTLSKYNIPILLTKKELLLVTLFVTNINQNVSYSMIRNTIWIDRDVSDSTIRDSVSRLKRKIVGFKIENIASFGYILKNTENNK